MKSLLKIEFRTLQWCCLTTVCLLAACSPAVQATEIELDDPDGIVQAAYERIVPATVPLRATWIESGTTRHTFRRGVMIASSTPGKCLLVVRNLTFDSSASSASGFGSYASSVSIWTAPGDGDFTDDQNWKEIRPIADSMAAGMTFFEIDCEDPANVVRLSEKIPEEGQQLVMLSNRNNTSGVAASRLLKAQPVVGGSYFSCSMPTSQGNPSDADFIFDLAGDLVGVATGNMIGLFGTQLPAGQTSFLWVADVAYSLRDDGRAVVVESLMEAGKKRRIELSDEFGRPVVSGSVTVTWSDDHKELQALSAKTGRWTNISIPQQDVIVPIVGHSVCAVQLDASIAAYSSETGTWDLLEIEDVKSAVVSVDSSSVKVNLKTSSRFYVFPVNSGVWTSPNDPVYRQKKVTLTDISGGIELSPGIAARLFIQRDAGGLRLEGRTADVDAAVEEIRQSNRNRATNSQNGLMATARQPNAVSGRRGAHTDDVQLALQLRASGSRVSEGDRKRLTKLVESILDEKLNQQRKLADTLGQKLRAIESALEAREASRTKIVLRRVEELLNPAVNWEDATDRGQSGGETGTLPSGPPKPSQRREAKGPLAGQDVSPPGFSASSPEPNSERLTGNDTLDRLVEASLAARKAINAVDEKKEIYATWNRSLEELNAERASFNHVSEDMQKSSLERWGREVRDAQDTLKVAIIRWNYAWKLAQSEVNQQKMEVNKAASKVEIAQLALEQAKDSERAGTQQRSVVRESELKIEIAKADLTVAHEKLALISEYDADELNPSQVNTKEQLKPVEPVTTSGRSFRR